MTDDDWIGVDEAGHLAAFSSEGMRPKRNDALTGRALRTFVVEQFADALVRGLGDGKLPPGGQFLPCVCIAKSRAPFDDPDVMAPVRTAGGGFAAMLDTNFPAERADVLMMNADVFVFDYDDKSLRAAAAIAGIPTYDPVRTSPVNYVRYAAGADKTLRPYQQAMLAREVVTPQTRGDLPEHLRDRLTPVRAHFATDDSIDIARSADVIGGVLTLVTPTGLTDASAAPRWPVLLLLAGAGLIALLFFFL